MTLIHATCIALKHRGDWHGVLLRGPSGSGKSDLALRLIEMGGRLIADDQTRLVRKGQSLLASAPAALAGLIEARGVGIVKLARAQLLARAPLALAADLVPDGKVERMPEPAYETILGVVLPVFAVAPFEASATMKLRLALAQIAAA